jgi:hypothetical protein
VATLWDHDPTGSCEASLFQEAVTHVGVVPVSFDVEITTLDDFCSTRGIKKIDYLKVDVEGSERVVFEGGQRMIQNGIDNREQGDGPAARIQLASHSSKPAHAVEQVVAEHRGLPLPEHHRNAIMNKEKPRRASGAK